MKEEWRYYNHALIPTVAPHEIIDGRDVHNRLFWKGWQGRVFFARWTSDFDCQNETDWWYVIKDSAFDINILKSKRRYEIKKGLKNFDVKIIHAIDFKEEIYAVTQKAYQQYPEKYRPELEHDTFVKSIEDWDKHEVYAAFYKETNQLCGYAWGNVYDSFFDFCVLKADPEFEKYALNAAIVYSIVERYSDKLGKSFYICDGSRATVHETKFQDYLEKYFGFRKAYCRLNMAYPFPINILIKIIYPFRNILINFLGGGKKANYSFIL